VLGELVRTTKGKWIIHPLSRCPGTSSAPAGRSWVIRLASATAADTRRGRAESHCATLDGPAARPDLYLGEFPGITL
jgi:hypothetical protein